MKSGIEVQTAQNVSIELEKASLKDRIFAQVIDNIIKILYILLLVLIGFLFFSSQKTLDYLDSDLGVAIFLISVFVLLLPYLFYTPFFESINAGQTPGKKVMKIKVVMVDGSPLRFSAVLLRWLLLIFDRLFYGIPGIISILNSPKGQRIGDMVAKTGVISLRDIMSLEDTLFVHLDEKYVVKYPEAKNLQSHDIEVIKQVLSIDKFRDDYTLVLGLSNRIQGELNIKTQQLPVGFLETILKDYYHMA